MTSSNPTSELEAALRVIAERVWYDATRNTVPFERSMQDAVSEMKRCARTLCEEAIGQPEAATRGATQNPANPMYWTKRTATRNDLRAEQRQRLGELTKGKDGDA